MICLACDEHYSCILLWQDLYIKICGVSYIGDVRMGFAEDSRKTDRIAKGSAAGLAQMYNKRLQVCVHCTWILASNIACLQLCC